MKLKRIIAFTLSSLLPLSGLAACADGKIPVSSETAEENLRNTHENTVNVTNTDTEADATSTAESINGRALTVTHGTSNNFNDDGTYVNYQTGEDLNRQLNAFACKLKSHLQLEDNYAFSPLSLWLLLGLFQGGVDAEISARLDTLLYPEPLKAESLQTQLQDGKLSMEGRNKLVAAYLHYLQNPESFIQINNLIAKIGNGKWQDAFLQHAAYYNAALAELDATQIKTATDELNRWIADNTRNLITDFFEKPLTGIEALLINTLAFNGKWLEPFDKAATQKADFKTAAGDLVNVNLMTRSANENPQFLYAEDDYGEYLCLPYVNNDEMVWILPKEGKSAEAALEHYKNNAATLDFQKRKGTIKLLKFDVTSAFNLNETLSKAGLEKIFSDNADLKNFLQGEILKVSQILQKTKVEVDEVGTKAASVSAIMMEKTAMPLLPEDLPAINFITDRPFAYVISSYGIPFLEGVESKPQAAA